MGMYDEIMLPCPKCGALTYEQSKGGGCNLDRYYYPNVPDKILGYIVNEPQECDMCGCKFSVKAKFTIVSALDK